MSNTCKWILKTGPYSGRVCGNKCVRELCSQHHKLYANSVRRTEAIRSIMQSETPNPIFDGVNARITTAAQLENNIATEDRPTHPFDTLSPANQTGTGQEQRPKKSGKYEKHKWSVYLITVNSQKDAVKMTEDEQAKFKAFIDKNILGDGIYKYIEDKKNPSDPRKNIINILQDGKFEVGEQQGRLHFHGIVRIEHIGLIQLHANKFRNDAKKELGYPIYFTSPVSSDPIAAYQQYFEKKTIEQ